MCHILALNRTDMKAWGGGLIMWYLNTCKDQSHDNPGIFSGNESKFLKKQGMMSIDVLNFGVGKKTPENAMYSEKQTNKWMDHQTN